MPMFHHELKCWPAPFAAIVEGTKTHEVRSTADRKFFVGERILLREWLPGQQEYTGRSEPVEITYISEPGSFGLPKDLAVLSIRRR
jgi:hypothetical protein